MVQRHWDGTEYLRKHQLLPLKIDSEPNPHLSLVITIPSHDEPDLLSTLESLSNCSRALYAIEVIVGLNFPDESPTRLRARHDRCVVEANEFAIRRSDRGFRIHIVDYGELSKRHAGVGLARKLIMDEAVARLCQVGNNRGIIACLDADCTVSPNYMAELIGHFQVHPKSPACSIYFEHPLSLQAEDQQLRAGISRYELYLRYYVHALRCAGFPHAYQTVGSSMAVRCDVYQRQGGMNRRQGGEDFHFLSKIIPLGGFSELRSTTVYPSPRVSRRAPFGTGRAMADWIDAEHQQRLVYPLAAFDSIRTLCMQASRLWDIPSCHATELEWISASFARYLDENDFRATVRQIKSNAASAVIFEKHLFRWLNGFRVLKYLHWLRLRGQVQVPVESAAAELLRRAGLLKDSGPLSAETLLEQYRRLDRNGESIAV
jgi:hypothetical protein